MKRNYSTLLICCFLSIYTGAFAQPNNKVAEDTLKNFRFNALPIVFYAPETGFGYGGLALSTFRFKGEAASSRPSSIQLGVTLTSKKQVLLFMPYELYLDDEKWRFIGELGFYNYFYNFYGRGINAPEEDLETYTADFPRFRFSALREVAPNIGFGVGYEFDGFNVVIPAEGGLLENSNEIRKTGGTISNIGILAFYDTRDNVFVPSKGFFIQANAYTSSKALGSSFSYQKFEVDGRYYQKIKGEHILASSLFFATRSKETPFLDLNYLGTKRTRGHDNRRYQDNMELSAALEYRFPIKGRFGGVLFGSSGTVAPTVGELWSTTYKNAAGTGLRYTINKKEGTRLRVDYAMSNEGGNFYFTIKEAF